MAVKKKGAKKTVKSEIGMKDGMKASYKKIKALKMDSNQMVITSMSISMLFLLLFIGAPSVFPTIINPYLESSLKIMQAIVLVPTVFFVLTVIANFVRFIKIVKLQKILKNK